MHINFLPDAASAQKTRTAPAAPSRAAPALPASLDIRAAAAAQTDAVVDESPDLRQILRQLWQRRLRLTLCMMLGLMLGGAYVTWLAVPRYPGVAVLSVEWTQKPDRAALNTQQVILGSRALLGPVAASLGLMADPEFNPALPATDPGMRLTRWLNRTPQPTTPEAQQTAVIDGVIAALTLRNIDQSLAYEVQITTRDPAKSARLANTIAQFYAARLAPNPQGIAPRRAQILSMAQIRPALPPGKGLTLLIAALIGLGVGAGSTLVQSPGTPRFRTPSDLRRSLGRPVLGAVPTLPGRTRTERLAGLRLRPEGVGAEAFRQLRSSALLSDIDAPPQVMVITSSQPGEGKTTLTLGLAHTIASQGKKVLVIEGDLRKRAFAGYFKTGETLDLLEVMRDPNRLHPGAFPQNILGIDVVSAGRLTATPTDFFASEAFKALLTRARGSYDTILIDAPAALTHAEPRLLGHLADALLYAVQARHTRQDDVTQGIALFENAGLYLTGLVLTQAHPKEITRAR